MPAPFLIGGTVLQGEWMVKRHLIGLTHYAVKPDFRSPAAGYTNAIDVMICRCHYESDLPRRSGCTVALFWRVFTTVAAVNALCLVVLFGLASVQYDAVLSGLVRDRLAVVAQNLAEPFQAVAKLGLPIETVRNVDALLQRTRQSSAEITGIYLFDQAGNIVRTTEPVIPPEMAEAARAALNSADGRTWSSEGANSYLVASIIKAPDGKISGGVLIQQGDSGKSMQVQALEGKLLFISVAILVVSLGAAFVVLRISLAGHIRVFDALLAAYDRFERQAWRGTRPSEVVPEPTRSFGIDTGEIFALLEQSEDQYQAGNPSRTPRIVEGATS